ncbi:MAG: arylamine N-acetyltransferase [candidate division KSB1 bacterium]|nr:arylamine N-acetyltransferase [candidate division KSB1 bacterium]MDZ7334114.1 arylamine N-acetyltransferase [candidate division KSB1 bacterium]MDZ7356297.1 arylamine N-acetyltransferase [candidate division KSB1 bacterium]MDZ7377489.1 arylamine N-acetyltransferase [candidate division KSB1 bacterium]MDZ7401390.1 arylamine N-acetyltransferase [candidate division KSB1 bacterium]
MICLIPEQHGDSVRYFREFFQLKLDRPDLRTLQKILEKFATIPYENISKIIKLSRSWDNDQRLRLPEEVMDDHAKFHLGGTCFSLTFFLETILLHQGYQCYPVMADMKAGRNIHCAIIVLFNQQKFLVDPGYLLHTPLEINPQKPRIYRTPTTGIELQFNLELGCYQLFTFNKEKMTWRYNFVDRPCPPEEFLAHWQASFTKPSMHGICLTKIQNDGYIFIHKDFMRETTFTSKRNYNIKQNYHQIIHEIFGIDKQWIEQAQAALEFNLAKERQLGIFKADSEKLKSKKRLITIQPH